MSTQVAWVTIVGIIAGTILLLGVGYLAGRDLKVFSPPQCMGIMGRLRGHRYSAMSLNYLQPNCLRCGKRKEGV